MSTKTNFLIKYLSFNKAYVKINFNDSLLLLSISINFDEGLLIILVKTNSLIKSL